MTNEKITNQKITIQALMRGLLENGFSFWTSNVPKENNVIQFCIDKKNAMGENFFISREDSHLMEHRRSAPDEVLMYYDTKEERIIGCTFSFYELIGKIKKDCRDRVYTPDKGTFKEVTNENVERAMSLREAIEARYGDPELVSEKH